MLAAVEAVEAGEADVIVAAYLDRLTRSMRVREEVVERVEAVGGAVLAVDMGIQSNATATQWFTGTLGSAVNEYIRRTAAERSAVAQQRAIDRGVPPWANTPPGYRREVVGRRVNGARMWGPLTPDPETAPIVAEAFAARARGATIKSIREYLREHGIERAYSKVGHMLRSRTYLGELHFGDYEPNLQAHPAIVDRETWHAAQEAVVERGRRTPSARLLARLGVLRCGTCGSRMSVGTQTQNGRRYHFYRCPPVGDCPRRVTIGANIVEGEVVKAILDRFGGLTGKASVESHAHEADAELHRAQVALDTAIRSLVGLEDEPAARERLAELRSMRDRARERADHLGSLSSSSLTIKLADDWDRLLNTEQRAIIKAAVERVDVAPGGKGAGRLTITLRK